MRRDELGELVAFLAVCEERSFTRAAARLSTSQSALSHTVKRLEERLDLRLLTRTTRSVVPTEAGEQLAATLRPALDEIEARLDGLTALRERPAGTIRITSNRAAAHDILYPKVARLMAEYPDIRVEISVDQSFVDIVEQRFDAGVRLGESVARDMIAVRIGPDKRMLVAGSPGYLARAGRPQTPHDLTAHACINLRLPTLGGLYAWEFERDGRPLNVRVEGSFTSNDPDMIVAAAVDGLGLCCLPDDHLWPAGRRRPPRDRARRLVPAVPGLPPLLPEPAAVLARLRPPRRGAALARLRRPQARSIDSEHKPMPVRGPNRSRRPSLHSPTAGERTREADMETRGLTRRDTLLAAVLPVLGAGPAAAQERASDGRTLVAYLSRSGNTRVIAGALSRRYGADLFEIRTAEPYPADYEETVERAQAERDAEATPPLTEGVADITAYETVFIGFPIWGMALPAPMRTFLTTHELAGKTIVPFITHGGYGTGTALDTVAELAPQARIVTPLILEADQERATLNSVAAWLGTIEPEL